MLLFCGSIGVDLGLVWREGPEQGLRCNPAGSRWWQKVVGRKRCWEEGGARAREGPPPFRPPRPRPPRQHVLGTKRMEVGLYYGKNQEKAKNPARTSKLEIPLNNFFPFSFSSSL